MKTTIFFKNISNERACKGNNTIRNIDRFKKMINRKKYGIKI